MSRHKFPLFASTAAIAFLASPALAQDTPPPPADDETTAAATQPGKEALPNTEGAQEPTGGIEEIIVTAQRREENLQSVPVAVTALDAETLAKNDVRDVARVEVLTPGFSFGRSGSDARPAIRGVRTENVAASGDPTIGFYVDNIYQSRAAQANVPFVDVARVEVHRGPQGTLYGRNTYGGNITITTTEPAYDFGIGGSLLGGSYARRRGEAFVNVPLMDGLGFRVAGLRERMDGYIQGIDNDHDIYDRNTTYARAAVKFSPDGSDFTGTLRYSYWLEKGTGGGAFGYRVGGVLVNPTTGVFDITGVPLLVNPKALDGIADINGFDKGFPIAGGKLDYTGNVILRQRVEQHQISANLAYDFGLATLRSITGYTTFKAFRNADNDFSPRVTTCGAAQNSACSFDAQDDALRTFTQELQLASPAGQRFSWIAGVYYLRDDIYKADFFNVSETNPNGFATNAHPLIKSYAAFGQASFWVVPDVFRLTGGIRRTTDKKRITRDVATIVNGEITEINPAIVVTPLPGSGQVAGQPFPALNLKFKKTTRRANAEYHPAEKNMLYATVSTGFRSGGFNGGAFTNATIPGAFAPETVTAYEIGSKNRFLENRLQLNVSAYINNFKDLQVQNNFLVPGATPGTFTTNSAILNAASARAKGIEAEVVARPMDRLNLAGSVTLMSAKYLKYEHVPGPSIYGAASPPNSPSNPGGGYDLSGNRVPYQPKHKFTGTASYDIDLAGRGTLTPQATVLVSGAYYLTDFNTVLDYQKGFTKLDLRLGWVDPSERYSVEGFVNNVTNKINMNRATFGSAGINQNFDAPRMFGFRVGAKM